eukprot:345017_1
MASQLKRIAAIVRKSMRQFRIYKSTRARLSRFIPRASVRPKPYLHNVAYGGLITIAFGTSCILSTTDRNALCACGSIYPTWHVTQSKFYNILKTLRILAPDVNANRMLDTFKQAFTRGEDEVGLDFAIKLFQRSSVTDDRIARALFRIVSCILHIFKHLMTACFSCDYAQLDSNKNGHIKAEEMACCFTLFQTGSKVDRYQFMFDCMDFEHSSTVNKEQFRQFYATMLELQYGLRGLDEDKEEYAQRANTMVQKIFDQTQQGELNMEEFLHWCKKGDPEVVLLDETLSYVCENGLGIRFIA